MDSIKIPKSAFLLLIADYAEAFWKARTFGSSYWQGKEDAFLLALNYGWGLSSLDIQERKDFKQHLIDCESQNHE